jgi:nicotinamide mononucleotide adenylyltransferase
MLFHCPANVLQTSVSLQRGYDVWGSYMSPVADAYGKKGLAPVQHRLQMCQLAAADTSNVMVDSWEAAQHGYTRTVQVIVGCN